MVGLNVDNVLVELNGEEIPILDCSARFWVEEIKKSGTVELEKERKYFYLNESVSYVDEKNGIEIVGVPADDCEIVVYEGGQDVYDFLLAVE